MKYIFSPVTFYTLVVSAPSFSVHLPNHILGPSKTASKNAKNPVNLLKFDLENQNPENVTAPQL